MSRRLEIRVTPPEPEEEVAVPLFSRLPLYGRDRDSVGRSIPKPDSFRPLAVPEKVVVVEGW